MKKIIMAITCFSFMLINPVFAHNCTGEKHNITEKTQSCCKSKKDANSCCGKSELKQCSKNQSKESVTACNKGVALDSKMQCDKSKCDKSKCDKSNTDVDLSKNNINNKIKPWWKIW